MGGREGGREGGSEGGREGWREGETEGGREGLNSSTKASISFFLALMDSTFELNMLKHPLFCSVNNFSMSIRLIH